MGFDPTKPFEEVGPVSTLDRAQPFEPVGEDAPHFDAGANLLDTDRAALHATWEGKQVISAINAAPTADDIQRTKNQAFIAQRSPGLPRKEVINSWPNVRDSYAKTLGYKDGPISEGAFGTLLAEHYQADRKKLWTDAASPLDRLGLMFGDRGGMRDPDLKVEGALPMIGSESAGTKGGMFTIPTMQGDGTFTGLINSTNRMVAGLTTPKNVALIVGTGGAGELAAIADTLQMTRTAVALRAAKAVALGSFVAVGAKDTIEAADHARLIFNDPGATPAQKSDALATVVFSGLMTAAASKGTYDFAGKSIASPEQLNVVVQAIRKEAAETNSAGTVQALHEAADKLEPAPEAPKEGEAAKPAEPTPGPAKIQSLDNGGFVVTDANGKLIDYAATREEAKALANPEEAVKETPAEKPVAPAEFHAVQEGLPAEGEHPAIPAVELYNLTEDIPDHPKGSTVSRETLEKAGYEVPKLHEPSTDTKVVDEVLGNKKSEAPNLSKPESSKPSGETTGIAHRVSEARGTAAERGEGISAEDSVTHGRELLAEGGDPEEAVRQHSATGAISADTMALVRAQAERLGRAAKDAEEAHGPDSPEYKAAAKADAEWIKKIKPLQTEWHKIGQAQQGETEIDTGTFHGLRRAYTEASGKDFTAKQAEQAREVAGKVKEATAEAETAKQNVIKAALGEDAAKPRRARPSKIISDRAKEARARIASRLENAFTKQAVEGEDHGGLLSKENLDDLAIVASEYIAKGASKLADVSEHMVKEFGESIRPHLESIFAQAKEVKARMEDEQITAKVEAKKAELEARIKELQQKIDTKDLNVEPKAASRPDIEQIEKLKQERESLREQLTGMREDAAKAQAHEDAIANKAETIASHKAGEAWTPEQAKALWQDAKENYLDKGVEDFDDIRHGLAKDHNLPVEDVTKGLATPKGVREITDEMYAKASARRRTVNAAKDFVANAKYPGYQKFFRAVPSAFFNLATFGHGTVWSGTHSGVNWFNPEAVAGHFKALGQSFKLMGVHDGGAYHERMMQDLVRDPNFVMAKRAGLANDPFKYTDDYQNAGTVKMFRELGLIGNRGFDGLKLFRQFRFNQEWAKQPSSLQTPEMAKLIADSVNKATGSTRQSNLPSWTNIVFFAPRMELSRWAFLFGDPAKAAKTLILDRDAATPEAHAAAMAQVKQKAIIAGTYFAALAVNQGLLSATNSPQSINFTDPHKSDWLSFKVEGHNVGIISPMIGSVRFLSNLGHIAFEERNRYEAKETRFSEAAGVAADYARGKLSPFAKVATDVAFQKDFRGNTMPWSDDRISARSQEHGIHQYGYGEYAAKNLLPIPLQEAITDAWKAQGMEEGQASQLLHAVMLGAVAGTVGARVSEDHSTDHKK